MTSRLKRIVLLLLLFGVNLKLSAQELTIQAVAIVGNTKTNENIILRELPFSKGQTIKQDSLDLLIILAKHQLISLNLFNQVEVTYHNQNDSVLLHIQVVEKWYIWPIPAFEFADRNFNQWWDFNFDKSRINYGLYNFIYNIGGLNHTMKLSLISGYTKNLGIEYRVPYLNKRRQLGLSAGAAYKTNHEIVYQTINNKQQFYHNSDTTVNQRVLSFIELTYRPGLFYYHKLYVSFLNQNIHPSISDLNPDFANGKNSLSHVQLGYQFLNRKVDNRFYPTQGHVLNIFVSANIVKTNANKNWAELSLNAERYLELTKRFNFGIAANAQLSTTNAVIYPLNTALGYKRWVRGYEPYVMDGQKFVLFKSTLRYALFQQRLLNTRFLPLKAYKQSISSSYLTFFVDGGYVNGDRTINNLTNTTLLGMGLGWDWVFYYDKVIRFEYSINKNNQHGLYIHFIQPL